MPIIEDALEKFALLDPHVVFIVNSDRVTGKIGELSDKYGVDLNAAVLFLVVGDLSPDNLADYLVQEKELEPAKAKAIVSELNSQVIKPLERRLLFLNADPDKVGITPAEEKDIARRIFSEELMFELREQFLLKDAFNRRLFDLFEQDMGFKRELERALYANQEIVTSGNIMTEGKSVKPTVENWLKDFIDHKGTGDFNTVALSDYLTNTANTKSLSPEDRSKLLDVLNLYRNLKFFPDTVEGKPIDEWQIVPFDLTEVNEFIAKQNKENEAEKPEPISTDLTIDQKLAQYDWTKIVGIERRALLEELGVSLKDFVKWQNK